MIDLIIKKRGHGKTTDLVRMSAKTSIPILTHNPFGVKMVAEENNLAIPEPIHWSQYNTYEGEVYIDDLDIFLEQRFTIKPIAGTISSNE